MLSHITTGSDAPDTEIQKHEKNGASCKFRAGMAVCFVVLGVPKLWTSFKVNLTFCYDFGPFLDS